MSDRRPEKLYKPAETWMPFDDRPGGGYVRDASPADLIAAVRRGVESGTIKGEEKGWCSVHDAQSWDGRDLFCLLHPGDSEERSCQMERRLVIPVSDGGSET